MTGRLAPRVAVLALVMAGLAAGCSSVGAIPPSRPTSASSTAVVGGAPSAVLPASPSRAPATPAGTTASEPARAGTPSQVRGEQLAWRLPEPLSRSVVVAKGRSAIVAGGLKPQGVSSSLVFRVSADTGVTGRLRALPQPIHDAAGVSLAGRPTVVGGGGAVELSAVRSYGADRAWHVVGHLPVARSDLSVVAVSGGFLVIGGYDGASSPRQVLRSTDGRTFAVFATLRHSVRYAAAVNARGAVWLFGGEDHNRELSIVQRIDLHSGAVTDSSRLPHALGHAAAALIGDRILVMGGRSSPHRVVDTMWWFDPVTQRFSGAGRLPYPVADAGLLTTQGRVYLLGGETPYFTNRVTRVSLTS